MNEVDGRVTSLNGSMRVGRNLEGIASERLVMVLASKCLWTSKGWAIWLILIFDVITSWKDGIERVGGGWAVLGPELKWSGEQGVRIGGVMSSSSSSGALLY